MIEINSSICVQSFYFHFLCIKYYHLLPINIFRIHEYTEVKEKEGKKAEAL